MATNLALDDELIDAARELGCHKTKKAAVMAALEEYVRKRRLELLFELAGTVDYDLDPMELRREERRRAAERAESAERLWADEG
ncbi:MAG: type II toxin-antitoxin system VapB family antitoxin [Tepidiformaceae bacterium]